MKEVYWMDTRFELNIKKVGIKGDDHALYLYFNGNLVIKLGYNDMETAVAFLLKKAQQQQLPSGSGMMLDAKQKPTDV